MYKYFHKRSSSGENIYTSAKLAKLWPFGFSSVGNVTFESAAYIARYVCKKVSGDLAGAHYETFDIFTGEITTRIPEFGHMSLKPGIGMDFARKYARDLLGLGSVVINGNKMKIPKYYWNHLDKVDPLRCAELEADVMLYAVDHEADSSAERLKVRETVAKARAGLKKRSLL